MIPGRLLEWWRTRRSPTDESDSTGGERAVDTSRDLRIVRYIKEQGGRTTQQDLVSRLDVSEGTVSRDLDDLADDGVIVRRPTGRQNVVELDEDHAVDALVRRRDGSDR